MTDGHVEDAATARPPRRPVTDWATDFDHLSSAWARHAPEITADLRRRCPVAHTERFYGAYLVTRYDDVVAVAPLDRAENRHLAFGVGVHRCLGSNLARMELKVALQRWLARFADFEPAGAVVWTIGVHGPEPVPLRLRLR